MKHCTVIILTMCLFGKYSTIFHSNNLWEGFYKVTICGDLNENDLHWLIYLVAYSPVSGTIWEGGGALTEEVC